MKISKPNIVIFDCGDTLVHLYPSKSRILTEFLKEKGINAKIKDIKNAYRIVDFSFKQNLSVQNNLHLKNEFLIKLNLEIFKILGLSRNNGKWARELLFKFNIYKNWKLFPDVIPTLQLLKQKGFILAVLANWDNKLQDLLERLKIINYFSLVVSSSAAKLEKPDPKIFRSVIRKLNIDHSEVYYVGNEYETDVMGARKAKIKPILIDRSNNLPCADCLRFRNLVEAEKYLSNN